MFLTLSIGLPPEENLRDIKKELDLLEKNLKKWLWLYVIWLLWEMKSVFLFFAPLVMPSEPLPEDIAEDPLVNEMKDVMKPFILPGLIFGLICEIGWSCPYWLQLWAIKQKNLKRTKTAMKIMRIYMYFNIIPFAMMILGVVFYDIAKEMIRTNKYPIDPYMKELILNTNRSEAIIEAVRMTVYSIVIWVFTYGGGVKWRNYILKREELLDIKEKEE